jgi:diadenosine tetraphosphatase ApaH/serine/threonine PP2A family protein phosphatase
MALDRLSEDDCIQLAQTTMRWTRTVLSDASRDYLAGLPPRATADGVVVAHGSLDDSTYYVASAPEAARELERMRGESPHAEVLILGHTHRHAMFDRTSVRLRAPGEAAVSLPGERAPFLLNPGSVGQARERRARARCMLLDLDRREATFHAVPYDTSGCLRALRERGLPPNACHLPPSTRQAARRLLRNARDAVRGRLNAAGRGGSA